MAESVSLKIVNEKRFAQAISRKQARLNRRSIIYKKAVLFIDGWIQRNFDKDGKLAMGGGGWKPLKASTLNARAKGYGEYKKSSRPQILRNIGTLKRSWKHTWNNREGIIENYATAKGSTFYYGVAHDEGQGDLPERRILPEDRQIAPQIKKLFGKWIRTSLR